MNLICTNCNNKIKYEDLSKTFMCPVCHCKQYQVVTD